MGFELPLSSLFPDHRHPTMRAAAMGSNETSSFLGGREKPAAQ
jgi:hypothetical protein